MAEKRGREKWYGDAWHWCDWCGMRFYRFYCDGISSFVHQRSLWTPKCVCVCIVTSVPLFCLPFNRTKRIHSLFFIFLSLFFFAPVQTGIVFNVERCGFEPIFIHAQPTNLKGIHLFVHYCSVARRAQNWFDYTFFYIFRHFLTLARAASTYSEHE